jgi:membrane protein implicated in regulation of membrane protease activity
MTLLHAISPGILLTLSLWVLWYLLDPPLRAEGVSWTRLIVWLATPLGMYVFLARHADKPPPPASPVGSEGIVVRLSPLQVEVFGSFWEADCDAARDLHIGDRVRVVKREGLTLVVARHS